jgi:hypothetical protein
MSYAGPVSRGKRAREVELVRPDPSGAASNASRASIRSLPASTTSSEGSRAAFGAGLALGVALGAGLALLLAPQSGEDTRRSIARSSRHFRRRGGDAWTDLRDELHAQLRRRQRRSRSRREASSL